MKAKFPPKLPTDALDIDEDLIDLMNLCLNSNSHKRPTLNEIATILSNKLRSKKRGKLLQIVDLIDSDFPGLHIALSEPIKEAAMISIHPNPDSRLQRSESFYLISEQFSKFIGKGARYYMRYHSICLSFIE